LRQGAAVEELVSEIALAPLLVGITGKLDLKGADAAVRAALDAAFERLDKRCPGTPKVLLSALARGADTVAAEVALARPGWRVVAPLPFSAALYLEDFDEAGAATLNGLLADPKVRSFVVDPMHKPARGATYSEAELSRTHGDGAPRTDHYEQAGLFIAERAAILIAVMDAAEPPGRVGGSARIVHHRLTGDLDADAARVVAGSVVLQDPPRLVDRQTGPVWVVDLARLGETGGGLMVWNPGDSAPSPLSVAQSLADSLTLADGLEAFNRRLGGLDAPARRDIAARAGPNLGDCVSELKRLRLGLSAIQAAMIRRVRGSIRQLALLSLIAIGMFEIYADLGDRNFYLDLDRFQWAPMAAVGYIVFLLGAVFVYWNAGRHRWQRIAEDYRVAAEALRVQLVWWQSGLTRREDRIESYYQHEARGSVRQLRLFVNQLLDACVLTLGKPALDPDAARAWAAGQVAFFEQRIAQRRRELAVVEGATWFLFAASLAVGLCLPLTLLSPVVERLCMGPAAWPAVVRALVLLVVAAAMVGLFLVAIRARGSGDDGQDTSRTAVPVWAAGLVAGLALTVSLCIAATFIPTPDGVRGVMKWAKELIGIAVIMPAAVAGALRFVADKSSWSAELTGYEHARAHFTRGQAALLDAGPAEGPAEGERRQIILALGAEALRENETWLREHRERPLEPIVGG